MNARKDFNFLSPPMIALYISLGVILAIYLGFSIFFHWHYLPNTMIGSVECGFKSVNYTEETNAKLAEDYVLTLIDRNGTAFQIKGKDISYTYINSGEEAAVLDKQQPFSWPTALFQKNEYSLNISVEYDNEKLSTLIQELALFEEDYIKQPEDAYIQFNEADYTIVPEVMGCVPIPEQIEAEILAALDSEDSEIKLSDKCYVNPKYYSASDEISKAAKKIDSYLNATITYEIDGSDEDLSSDDIIKMLDLSDTFEVSIKTRALDRFVQQLATKYNTYGDKREFTTSKGDVITIGGGDYGWVISKSKEAAQILEDLEGGTPVRREPMYEQRAIQSGLNDIGDTYVEVDYTNQHMWVYVEGQLTLESDFVSGNMGNGNGSPDGIFKIVYKERDAILRGEDYTSPVSYFMPFAYNVGFHDATWRNSFGKQIYKTNGSHGCINLPPDFAKALYESVEVGTPVIAYYREPIVLSSENAKISNAYSYVAPPEEETVEN